ncbi:hypothetical protein ABT071_21915 [Streptomyces sp. NPDC002506]|uniref:hypothetical protein n=1 Tax=Streptomyces sp. NPDC002506 TaxID=3154536 RepID=UPI003330A81A
MRTVPVEGGQAVFDMGDSSASLVSATPAAGWSKQVVPDRWWIRVVFTNRTGQTVSVMCSWYQQAPRVDVVRG